MFENNKKNNITLEPKRNYIINDINIKEYDLTSLLTLIFVLTLFLLSLKFSVLCGM